MGGELLVADRWRSNKKKQEGGKEMVAELAASPPSDLGKEREEKWKNEKCVVWVRGTPFNLKLTYQNYNYIPK